MVDIDWRPIAEYRGKADAVLVWKPDEYPPLAGYPKIAEGLVGEDGTVVAWADDRGFLNPTHYAANVDVTKGPVR